jgi:hypothetical protein
MTEQGYSPELKEFRDTLYVFVENHFAFDRWATVYHPSTLSKEEFSKMKPFVQRCVDIADRVKQLGLGVAKTGSLELVPALTELKKLVGEYEQCVKAFLDVPKKSAPN